MAFIMIVAERREAGEQKGVSLSKDCGLSSPVNPGSECGSGAKSRLDLRLVRDSFELHAAATPPSSLYGNIPRQRTSHALLLLPLQQPRWLKPPRPAKPSAGWRSDYFFSEGDTRIIHAVALQGNIFFCLTVTLS